ncbi:MAG: NAD(P)/FAD-dependent oxidoreductase [Elainellaceae cyanobacterium]
MVLQVVVIGGGAAGFFAAIACAEAHSDAQVTLLEAGRRCLSKVAISGGGRCNVTHACFDPARLITYYPRGGKALRGAFSRFQPQDTVRWFSDRGVALKTEADGRMFPVTDDSGTIMDCLQRAARRAGVMVHTGAAVSALARRDGHGPAPKGHRFHIELKSGERVADRVILATGSSARGQALARSLGHCIEPPVPSLFTLNIRESALNALAGVAVDPVRIQLRLAEGKSLKQTGPLLLTHWGVSGPAVLRLSAWGARHLHGCGYRAELRVNWLPTDTEEQVRQVLLDAKRETPKRTLMATPPALAQRLPRRLWGYLLARAGVAPQTQWAQLPKAGLQQLVHELTQGEFAVAGKGVFKDEFVTCGGVRLSEVAFKTMESRCCPGLYFAGEVLDIDGITGGFNFQSAWTTGWLAGRAASRPADQASQPSKKPSCSVPSET